MPQINWNDTINLAGKITFKRLWNGIKVLGSFYATRLLNRRNFGRDGEHTSQARLQEIQRQAQVFQAR